MIGRAAELAPERRRARGRRRARRAVSEYLAERAAHVHVVELDRALEPALRDALDPHANATLHLADAVKLDLAALDPAPTKVVANLPYGVAATVILRTIELPSVHDLGRDGAEGGRRALRRRARHAGLRRAVGARPARLRRARRCARSRAASSIPVPNVDSVLVGLRAPRAGAAARRCARSSSRASPTAARRSRARSRWPRSRRPAIRDAHARRARGDRPARRRPRRDALARRVARAVGAAVLSARARPARSTSACSSARRAPTACTRSSRSSSRWRSPTS